MKTKRHIVVVLMLLVLMPGISIQAKSKCNHKNITWVTKTKATCTNRGLKYQAGHYLEGKNPYAVNQKDVRKNAIRINELYEECKYILKNDIKTEDDLLEKQNALLAKEKQLMNCRSSLRSVEDKEMLRQYRALKKRLSDTPDWDDRFEIYQEELNTFLKQMPEGMLKAEEERQQINAILQEIRHEKRIVNRIVEEERSLNKEQKISKTERTEIRHRR